MELSAGSGQNGRIVRDGDGPSEPRRGRSIVISRLDPRGSVQTRKLGHERTRYRKVETRGPEQPAGAIRLEVAVGDEAVSTGDPDVAHDQDQARCDAIDAIGRRDDSD